MENNDVNTEQAILRSAEEVFLSKGYAASRTTEIAQLAGVNHAMLHYYFRTKENLFNQVFEKKVQLFTNSFLFVFEQDIPFLDKVKLATEAHFDFIMAHPKLPNFILGEILINPERRTAFVKKFSSKIFFIFESLEEEIRKETGAGNITDITVRDLILNIASLNVFSIIAGQVLYASAGDAKSDEIEQFYQSRKKNNVETILKSLTI